jgi:predicted transcriptional regulator of viral defense system
MYPKGNRYYQKALLEHDQHVFRTADLAVLWGISNKNTLRTTIKRYMQRGILYPIMRGLYSTRSLNKLHPYELGCAIAGSYSYVSTETVLSHEGIINQIPHAITLIGKKKKDVTIAGQRFAVRVFAEKFLVQRVGIHETPTYSIASLERAVADMLHIRSTYYFDNMVSFDQKKVDEMIVKIGYRKQGIFNS